MMTLHRVPLRTRTSFRPCAAPPLRYRVSARVLSHRSRCQEAFRTDRWTGPASRSLVEYLIATTAVFGILCALFL
ncbi:MAG: hypothetical protein JNL10_10995 [Verrucomicrobiales bacterium]|nr:hypothetical protein [Verrucomicrobiales bacterium]